MPKKNKIEKKATERIHMVLSEEENELFRNTVKLAGLETLTGMIKAAVKDFNKKCSRK